MDPRHPEQAISRMRELMKQYDRIEKDMAKATTSAKLAELEREGGLVVQEICLVAPRVHEAMMQTSRQRRHDLSHGVIVDMSKYEVPAGATGEEEGVVVEPEIVEKPVEKSQEKCEKEAPKQPEKCDKTEAKEVVSKKETTTKKTTKKKTTKKAKK